MIQSPTPSNLPRFHAFLLYLGYTPQAARDVRIMQFCHTLREFALEYRTCRERVLQQQQKRATYRERNKTRGRMITERSSQVWLGRPPITCLSQWLWAAGQVRVILTIMPA